jgi:hypothetical protein
VTQNPRTYEAPTLTVLGRINPHRNGAGAGRVVVDVRSSDGWRLVIAEQHGGGFRTTLTDPTGKSPYEGHYAKTVDLAVESACGFVRDHQRNFQAANALRLMAAAELRR